MTDNDLFFMKKAIEIAQTAAENDEVPVGAVVVKDGEIIAVSGNKRETNGDATAHAETEAIRQACEKLGRWRLSDCELYVTLEPCPMCAGAILNAKINRVVYGAKDPRGGALGSLIDLRSYPFYHKPRVECGIMADECKALLREFFVKKREVFVVKENSTKFLEISSTFLVICIAFF